MPKLTGWGATCPNLGSNECPCVLADFQACPNCSHLAGYPLCACDWRGFCPFLERQWSDPQPVRAGSSPRVVASSQSAPRLLELAVSVGDRSLEPYMYPGTVVRIGMVGSLSGRIRPAAIVSDVDLRRKAILLTVGLAQIENMLLGEADRIWVDPNPGNMLLGGGRLAEPTSEPVLLVASGIGQSGLTLVVKELRRRGVAVTAVIAPGKAGASFMVGRAQSIGAFVHEVGELAGKGREITARLLQDQRFGLVVSLGGDDQNRWLGQVLADTGSMLPVVACDTYRYPFLSE